VTRRKRRADDQRVTFHAPQRQAFLDALTAGAKISDAALTAGVTHQWVNRLAKQDAVFAVAYATARELGRKVRQEATAHGESRYNHLGCRCTTCTRAATAARTGRRHRDTEHDDRPDTADTTGPDQPKLTIITNSHAQPAEPLPLARAS
jgi:hypothetical protein